MSYLTDPTQDPRQDAYSPMSQSKHAGTDHLAQPAHTETPMTNHNRIRVLVVDDHAMVRRGLATFLQVFDDLELVDQATSGAGAIRLCAEHTPDVVLMDLLMPERDGATATRLMRTQFPQVKVIALTSFAEPEVMQQVLHAGAISYLLKNVSANELHAAIHAAYAGRSTFAPEATAALLRAAAPPLTPGHDLTQREREVLALLVKGLNNTEIAARLQVSPSTIKAHVSNILAKLAVHSRTEAVAMAVQQHLVR